MSPLFLLRIRLNQSLKLGSLRICRIAIRTVDKIVPCKYVAFVFVTNQAQSVVEVGVIEDTLKSCKNVAFVFVKNQAQSVIEDT